MSHPDLSFIPTSFPRNCREVIRLRRKAGLQSASLYKGQARLKKPRATQGLLSRELTIYFLEN